MSPETLQLYRTALVALIGIGAVADLLFQLRTWWRDC